MSISRKATWFIAIIVIVLLTAVGVYKFYKSRFLGSRLPDTVRSESNGLYKITYDTIVVDEVAGSLLVRDVAITADTNMIRADSAGAENPSILINLTAAAVVVYGVETPRALLNREISGSKLIVKDASLELFRLTDPGKKIKDSTEKKSTADIIESISADVLSQLSLVQMDTIRLENINITYRDFKTKQLILSSNNVSLNLYDLRIDSKSLEDTSRILFAKNVEFNADTIRLRDPKNIYDFRFHDLKINTANKELSLGEATISPMLGEQAFVNQFKTQKDRFSFSLKQITIKNIAPGSLAIGELYADSMFVRGSRFMIYRDLNRPRDQLSRVGQYPHQVIMDVPFPLNIRQLFFTNSYVEYKERNEKTKKAGRVQFHRVAATMHNVTNQPSAISKNNMMTIDFSAWFLNTAKADVRMSLRLGDKQGRFAVSGKLASFDARKINVLTEPMGLARVERGTVNGLSFNMTGDNHRGDGELVMLYDGLKISTLKQDEDGYRKKGLVSLFANMIVKNKNPSGGETRRASMANERNTNRSFFNLVWKSIFTGVKETAGMDKIGNKKKK